MATAILRPNGTISPDTAVVTPSGTAHDATNDSPDDDTTYFTKLAGENWTTIEFGSTTLPANSLVKLIEPSFRARSVGTTGRGETQLRSSSTVLSTSPFTIDDSFAEHAAQTYANPALTQSQVDALRLAVRSTADDVRFSELFIAVTAAEQPTTDANAPTGTVTTSTPSIEWQHTAGTDGGPQAAWHVKVFSLAQYTATGFDPDTSFAAFNLSGNNAATSVATDPLTHNTSYRAYVRTAQNVAGTLHWADWDFVSFTVDVIAPEIDSITLTVDSPFARIVADITRDTGGDAWDHIELQRMSELNLIPTTDALAGTDSNADGRTDGWDSDTDGTVSVTYSITGGYQRFTVTGIDAADEAELQLGELLAISGGADYSFGVTAKAPTLGANTALTLGIRFFDALGNVLESSSTVLTSAAVSSSAASYYHVGTAPENAAYAAPTIAVLGLTGATAAATTGDFQDAWFSEGGEEIWEDVAGAEDITPNADDVTVIDIGAPGDTPVRYRTRALDANDNAGDWMYALSYYEWEQEASWIKCPTRPGFSTTFCLAVRPELTQPRDRAVHRILRAKFPRTVSGPMQSRQGVIEIETFTEAEFKAVMKALEEPVALFQFLPEYSVDQLWGSIGDVRFTYPEDRYLTLVWRNIFVDVVEVSGP